MSSSRLCAAPCRLRPPAHADSAAVARRGLAGAGLMLAGLALWAPAGAEPHLAGLPASGSPADPLATEVAAMVKQAAAIVWGESAAPPRIEVQVGRLDARLRLAPCQQIVPYLPAGSRPIGRTMRVAAQRTRRGRTRARSRSRAATSPPSARSTK